MLSVRGDNDSVDCGVCDGGKDEVEGGSGEYWEDGDEDE